MPSLTDTLRTEHAVVMSLVEEVRGHLRAGKSAPLGQTLTNLKTALLTHLRHEDEVLYPGLIQLAQSHGDATLERTGKAFQDNMKRITTGLEAFLRKYDRPSFDLKAFETEWKSVVELLVARITAEEKTLYSMYDRISAKRG